jgi:hypothetical protein
MMTAVAYVSSPAPAFHPSTPHSSPPVAVVIDPLTGYLVAEHDGTTLFTLLGETYVRTNLQTVLA